MAGGTFVFPVDDEPPGPAKNGNTNGDDLIPTVPPEGNPKYLYLLICCSTIGGFLFGYDTGVISGALVLLKSPEVFNLTAIQSESVVSAAIFGAIVGAALSSCGNHMFGRKPVILFSSCMFTFGSLLMGTAETFMALLFGRLIVGLGVGFSSMAVPLYIAEVSPPHVRGRLVSLNTLLVTGGQFFACVLDALLSEVKDGWRFMLGLAALPALLQFLGFILLPESPRYLVNKGKKEAAWTALVKIRGTDDIETEFNHIEAEVQRHQKQKVDLWHDLRVPSVVRAMTLGCFLQALQQLCGINTVMYYGASIIQMAGFTNPSTAIWLSAVVSFSNFLFTFVGIYLVDHSGRRLLTLWSLVGVTLSLLALGASFYAAEVNSMDVTAPTSGACAGISSCFDCVANAACGYCASGGNLSPFTRPGQLIDSICIEGTAEVAAWNACPTESWSYASCPGDSRLPGWLIFVTLFIYLACFASGMGCMPWTINAEIYPLNVRSFALSMATSVNWVSNLVVSFTFLSIIELLAPYGAFWLYACIAFLGFLYLYKELPETKGLALEEIQQIFDKQKQYAKIDK